MANIGEVFGAASAVVKGMGITLREMMSPTVTENYPDEPAKLQERYRGAHELQRDANGLEKCVACFLCAAACPANCIYIEAAENTEKTRISGGERYAIPFFCDSNIDWPIAAVPTTVGPDKPPKYPTTYYTDYMAWYQKRNYDVLNEAQAAD